MKSRQISLYDEKTRMKKFSKTADPFEVLNEIIKREMFRNALNKAGNCALFQPKGIKTEDKGLQNSRHLRFFYRLRRLFYLLSPLAYFFPDIRGPLKKSAEIWRKVSISADLIFYFLRQPKLNLPVDKITQKTPCLRRNIWQLL